MCVFVDAVFSSFHKSESHFSAVAAAAVDYLKVLVVVLSQSLLLQGRSVRRLTLREALSSPFLIMNSSTHVYV